MEFEFNTIIAKELKKISQARETYKLSLIALYLIEKKDYENGFFIGDYLIRKCEEESTLEERDIRKLKELVKKYKLSFVEKIQYSQSSSIDCHQNHIIDFSEQIALCVRGKVLKINPKWESFVRK